MMTLSIADARANFSRIVESASVTHERYEVTRNGRRAAVLMGADDFDALIETIAILGDAELVAGITRGLTELSAGVVENAEDVATAMRAAGRPAP